MSCETYQVDHKCVSKYDRTLQKNHLWMNVYYQLRSTIGADYALLKSDSLLLERRTCGNVPKGLMKLKITKPDMNHQCMNFDETVKISL